MIQVKMNKPAINTTIKLKNDDESTDNAYERKK